MDYRVKIDPEVVPSAAAFIDRNRKLAINGVLFGKSDILEGYVSEPVRESDFAAFDNVPGYYLVRADDGAVVREPKARVVTESDNTDPTTQKTPEQTYADKFLKQFQEDSQSERNRTNNDEYKRALRALNIAVPPEATKAEMIALVEDYLTSN